MNFLGLILTLVIISLLIRFLRSMFKFVDYLCYIYIIAVPAVVWYNHNIWWALGIGFLNLLLTQIMTGIFNQTEIERYGKIFSCHCEKCGYGNVDIIGEEGNYITIECRRCQYRKKYRLIFNGRNSDMEEYTYPINRQNNNCHNDDGRHEAARKELYNEYMREYENYSRAADSEYSEYERALSQADTEKRYAEDYENRARLSNDESYLREANNCYDNAKYYMNQAQQYYQKYEYYKRIADDNKEKARCI